MKILLLERFFRPADIFTAIKNYMKNIINKDVEIFLFTSDDSKDFIPVDLIKNFNGIKFFKNYYSSALIEFEAIYLYKNFKFDKIIALREFDLIRAARIRKYLGIPGTQPEQLEVFRDKLEMKKKAREIGLPVPLFSKVDNTLNLISFINEVGYPIVVKPRKKAGGLGFAVINDNQCLKKYLEDLTLRIDIGSDFDLIAEKYIDKKMVHIDGIFHKGTFAAKAASKYIGLKVHNAFSIEEYYKNQHSGSITLANQEQAHNFFNFTEKLLKNYDSVNTYAFHIELWVDEDGSNIMLNEAAARIGGGYVYYLVNSIFELPLEQCLFEYLCFDEDSFLKPLKDGPLRHGFSGKIPVLPGVIQSVPEQLSTNPFFYQICVKEGEKFFPPSSCYDHMGLIVTTGASPEICLEKFNSSLLEFNNRIVRNNV